MIKRMLQIAKPWWGSLFITVLTFVAASLLNLVTPEAVRRLTALLGEPEKLTGGILLTYVCVMVGAYLLRGVCMFLALWQSHVAAWN
ncbi:MAG: ABC transporter ATP-binding protein, partial [Clostridia bacterium]|nr:ABC transporter ATP-binding protein [Clostridia bacterium]